jgi:hypothetical protein
MKPFISFLLLLLLCTSNNAQTLLINEFEARNTSTVADEYGGFDDWIEIKNAGASSINLNGYYITDNLTNKTNCRLSAIASELIIPAGGHLILWADNEVFQGTNHLSFKLSGSAGFIGLLNPSAQWIDSVSYSNQAINISKGRDISVNSLWKYYSNPTPGVANNTNAYIGISEKPIFSYASGCFNVPIQVSLSKINPLDTIHYTLNNADPKNTSSVYSTPIAINKTEVIRAIGNQAGYINSEIVSHIYFRNTNHTLPILAIITDTLNLFGSTGIYTNYDQSGQEWERFCQIKYIKNGYESAESNAGVRIQGASSVGMPKKSFRLFFRDEYGNGKFNYPLNGSQNVSEFDKLVLKSGYDDDITTTNGTLLRDALSVELWKRVGGLPQNSTWAVLYLNNRYWGIYNIRESIDETYIKDHTGFTNFDLVRFHNEGPEIKYGSTINWNNLYSLIQNQDISIPSYYQIAESMMDMGDFITLMSFVQCAQYYSWCWGISMFKNNILDGKWKFSIWDSDRAYLSKENIYWNGFNEAENLITGIYWSNIFPKKLCKNEEFRRLYVNRMCDLMNSTFKPENAIAVFDSIYNIIKPEIPNEYARWYPSGTKWENNVENIRDYLNMRPNVLIGQIKEYFSLSNMHTLTVNINGKGKVKVNLLTLTQYPWQGNYFENNFIDIEAIPDPGYHFAGWDIITAEATLKKSINLTENKTVTAYFESGETNVRSFKSNNYNLIAYPNPFVDGTIIKYNIDNNNWVNISVISTDGKLIKNLYNGNSTSGEHTVNWNGDNENGSKLQNGLYFIRLQTSKCSQYLKVIKAN